MDQLVDVGFDEGSVALEHFEGGKEFVRDGVGIACGLTELQEIVQVFSIDFDALLEDVFENVGDCLSFFLLESESSLIVDAVWVVGVAIEFDSEIGWEGVVVLMRFQLVECGFSCLDLPTELFVLLESVF